jgi:ATP-binding cassette subfamily D (ALD) protein 3
MSIWLADVNGKIVKSIVERNFNKFLMKVFNLFLFSVPSSAVNAALDYFQKLLAVSFRERITTKFHDDYLQKMFYYKICNLDSRISNPDQRLTQDADKWAMALASLYLNVTKPILDITLFSQKLAELVGKEGVLMVYLWYMFSGIFIRYISPAFGKLTAMEQKIEGEYRSKHTDLLNHAEEISFYNGGDWEKTKINAKFYELINHIKYVLHKKFIMGIFDSMLVKYGAFMVGYTVVGLPVFGPGSEEYLKSIKNDPTKITKDYVRNSSLLINLSKAIGRMVVSYKDLQNLAGYTTLISEMEEVLSDLKSGRFKRTQVTDGGEDGKAGTQIMAYNKMENKGKIVIGDNLKFVDVPILSPNGDILVDAMNFEIKPGMHLMITGPNGCGKSSLFRIMGALWPVNGGELHKPPIDQIFYIPQRPYLPNGTLRDQLIYPDAKEDQIAKNITDEDMNELLRVVKLEYLIEREGSWDTENDWNDVLSGGEKQRMAMGRLIYHRPKYAILDECTSAVSIDVEGHLYNHMKQEGITLITVSHRDTLWKYHDYLLKFEGDKQYSFKEMPEDRRH